MILFLKTCMSLTLQKAQPQPHNTLLLSFLVFWQLKRDVNEFVALRAKHVARSLINRRTEPRSRRLSNVIHEHLSPETKWLSVGVQYFAYCWGGGWG